MRGAGRGRNTARGAVRAPPTTRTGATCSAAGSRSARSSAAGRGRAAHRRRAGETLELAPARVNRPVRGGMRHRRTGGRSRPTRCVLAPRPRGQRGLRDRPSMRAGARAGRGNPLNPAAGPAPALDPGAARSARSCVQRRRPDAGRRGGQQRPRLTPVTPRAIRSLIVNLDGRRLVEETVDCATTPTTTSTTTPRPARRVASALQPGHRPLLPSERRPPPTGPRPAHTPELPRSSDRLRAARPRPSASSTPRSAPQLPFDAASRTATPPRASSRRSGTRRQALDSEPPYHGFADHLRRHVTFSGLHIDELARISTENRQPPIVAASSPPAAPG